MKIVLVKQANGIDWLAEGEILEWLPNMDVLIDSDGLSIHYDNFKVWDLHHWTITNDKVLTLVGLKSGSRAVLEVIE